MHQVAIHASELAKLRGSAMVALKDVEELFLRLVQP